MFFITRQKKIESLLDEYRQRVANCLEIFEEAFAAYLQEPDRKLLESNYIKVHKAESEADDIRREIEVMMYSKALFPESRGDILGLLETMDKVPNQAEYAVHMLFGQHIHVPEAYRVQLTQLVSVCQRCVKAMLEGAEKLFLDFTTATALVGKIDELESEADHLEQSIIEQVFASEMDGFEKLQMRDIVKQIAGISDRAENVGDRIRIIAAKRRV
ncbi:MAG: TIGR00153 family protein [Candidatus Brocadiia bacterium]|nr:MAG: TIGR00153 family protein [Candidatus Brocadiia bacterium]